MSYTSPTIFHVETPSMPTQPPVQDMVDDQWSGVLIWSRGDSDVSTSVLATHRVRDPMLSMWPTHLRLEIIATGLHPLDVQAWLLEHRAPVARIQCAPDTDSHDFGELITSLKERKSVAIVRWETREEGSKRGLVLAPLHGALLCAAFLTSDIPKLPMAPLQQPQARQDEQRCLLELQPALIDGLIPAVADGQG